MLFFTSIQWLLSAVPAINPLSKITISSNCATCQKDHVIAGQFAFNYQENVLVTFADNSTITANNLEVIFDSKNLDMKKFKRVVFLGNVVFTSQNRTAYADKAAIQVVERICILTGRVRIVQKKTAPKEIPITIESDEAKINLTTDELFFTGSIGKPVSTVILLDGYEPFEQKNKKKKK